MAVSGLKALFLASSKFAIGGVYLCFIEDGCCILRLRLRNNLGLRSSVTPLTPKLMHMPHKLMHMPHNSAQTIDLTVAVADAAACMYEAR